jgi:hypothetical protein
MPKHVQPPLSIRGTKTPKIGFVASIFAYSEVRKTINT